MLDLGAHPRLGPILRSFQFIDAIFVAIAFIGAVSGLRRALMNQFGLSAIGLIAPTRVSWPCNKCGSMRLSATLAAVASTE